MTNQSMKFWRWFFYGTGDKQGYKRIVNRWLTFHLLVGLGLSWLVTVELRSAANSVLLPLAGILIGLSFAWAGNAQALLQTTEMEELSQYRPGGFAEYVYTYQAAILCILVTLVAWGLAGLEVFDIRWPTRNHFKTYFLMKALLFMLSSLTLRECWHVVMSAQLMLLTRRDIRRAKEQVSKSNSRTE